MPADHGTPNTGDEREKYVRDWLDRWRVPVASTNSVREFIAGFPSPSRDGAVAVEDVVARIVARLRSLHEADQDWCARVIEREFGSSGRTERIHDQATKEEEHERRH